MTILSLASRQCVDAIGSQIQLDAQFLELLCVYSARRARHQVARPLSFWEGDTIADIVQSSEEHHPAVNSQRNSSVWGCAVFQCSQQEPEPFLGRRFVDPQQ